MNERYGSYSLPANRNEEFIRYIADNFPRVAMDYNILTPQVLNGNPQIFINYPMVAKFCISVGISKFYVSHTLQEGLYDPITIGMEYVEWILDNPEQFELLLL